MAAKPHSTRRDRTARRGTVLKASIGPRTYLGKITGIQRDTSPRESRRKILWVANSPIPFFPVPP